MINWIIAGITIALPLSHLWLHALLNWWRKRPILFYLAGLKLGLLCLVVTYLASRNAVPLFESRLLTGLGYLTIALGAMPPVFSFLTLGPKRFLLWAVLRPESVKQTRFSSGPFRFFPHPSYLGLSFIAFGNFLAGGQFYLLLCLLATLTLFPFVIILEERELKERLENNQPLR